MTAPTVSIDPADIVDTVLNSYEFALADGSLVTIPRDPGEPHRASPVEDVSATVTRLAWECVGSDAPTPDLVAATATLTAIASAAPARDVALRAVEQPDALVLDLARPGEVHGAVHVTASGWELVDPRAVGVLFGGSRATEPLPAPVRGGSRDILARILGLSPRSAAFRLVWGWLVCALFSSMPRPVLAVTGPNGAGKSTLARMVKSILDPALGASGREGVLGAAPTDDTAANTASAASHFVPTWDNVTRVDTDVAAWFASLVTGAASIRQSRGTSLDCSALRRTGILTTATLPDGLGADVRERLVAVELPRIAASARRTERALWKEFRAQHPAILGALLDDVVGVLALLDHAGTEPTELARMADYHEHLVALDLHLDTDPSDADSHAATYADSVAQGRKGDLFATAIARLAANGWEGTATELRDALALNRPREAGAHWPSGPSQVARALTQHADALAELGVAVRRVTRESGRRRLYLLDLDPTP